MSYTIKIDLVNDKAQSILNMLQALADDYAFLQISNDDEYEHSLTTEQEEELDRRLEIINSKKGVFFSWDEVEKEILEGL